MYQYASRSNAGRGLAHALHHHARAGALVLAIPRGGVLVAAPLAASLRAELDVLIVREIPFAVCVEGHRPTVDLERVIELGLHAPDVAERLHQELASIALHHALFRGHRPFPPVAARTVIVVDDGSSTLRMLSAAIQALRADGVHHLVLASPTIHPGIHAALRPHCDELVAAIDARSPEHCIRDFDRVTDDDVLAHLRHERCNVRSA